ncbi:MAG: four-helix bundle copper-binding protein [Pseudonocardiales bacterium]|nr:four-helix bundle copper-binding protein [Pseudonocardiales bacterium]
MTDTRAMLDTGGGDASPERAAAIDALLDCAQTCQTCAMAMVQSGGMAAEVRRAMDCGDLCEAAERILSRGPDPERRVVAAAVEAARVACEASAAACGAHADHHPHCRLHSKSAQARAEALGALQKSTSG